MSSGSDVAETHISRVFFTDDRAYKMLKPIRTSFLDFSDRDQRLAAAARELELNRRWAPDVYLGLGEIYEGTELTDRLIVMERMPDDRRLTALVDDPCFDGCVRSIARTVAAFHEQQAPVRSGAHMATRDAVGRNWEDNLADMAPYVGDVLDLEEYDRIATWARAYLAGAAALFKRRIDEGWVREGHGDLLAEDIFCLDDGPRILDCLAFSDDLRIGDVLADIGFLAMDLHRIAGSRAAGDLLSWYVDFTNEHHPLSLAHHYVAYRAHVRAKVACLRYTQGDPKSATMARTYHGLAAHHLSLGQLRLILVGGGPGTGKSTLADGLSGALGCAVLGSDEVRKDLLRVRHDEHAFAAPQQGIYTTEMKGRVYDELLRQAAALLERGESVVLDATWTSAEHREQARRVAREHSATCAEIECQLSKNLAQERVEARLSSGDEPSDATRETVDHLAERHDPWPGAWPINTAASREEVLNEAAEHVHLECLQESDGSKRDP